MDTCSVAEARRLLEQGEAALLDVREYPEWVEAHVAEGRLIPLGELRRDPAQVELAGPVLLLCRSGKRAAQAAEILQQRRDIQPVVIEGGIEAWRQAGYPVRTGKGPIALERQVRIAAGALVLTGILLDFVLPGARYLSLFVGAGLVFAGVTNTCAMGLLLAKLPWNRAHEPVAGGDAGGSCPVT